jgi:hypothetical protein
MSVWSDGEEFAYGISKSCSDHAISKEMPKDEFARICVSGPIIHKPERMAELCNQLPSVPAFACTLTDGYLRAFSALVVALDEKERPRRVNLCEPNEEALSGRKSIDYNDDLDGDGLGRMANMLFQKVPVVNQIRRAAGHSPFYGNLLLADEQFGEETYIIRPEKMKDYFIPNKSFGESFLMAHVPVEVQVTDRFKQDTETQRERVPILISSDSVIDLPVFMNFYHAFSGRSFVRVMRIQGDTPQNLPVYRYNKWYGEMDFEES